MLDTKTVLMIELFCTLLILAFVAISHRQTKVLAEIYNGNNIKTEDYTLFMPLTSSQMEVFDSTYFDSVDQNHRSRGLQVIDWISK